MLWDLTKSMLVQALSIFCAGTAEMPSCARKFMPSHRPEVPSDLFSGIAIMNCAPEVSQCHSLSDLTMRSGPTVTQTGSSVYTKKKNSRTCSVPIAAVAFSRACLAQVMATLSPLSLASAMRLVEACSCCWRPRFSTCSRWQHHLSNSGEADRRSWRSALSIRFISREKTWRMRFAKR